MKKFILIGVGSIGKRHLEILKKLKKPTICIDKNTEINKKYNPTQYPNIVGFYKNINHAKIKNLSEKKSFTIIISTLGPTHFPLLEQLSSIGFKNFIIEKPIVTSISNSYEFKKLVKKRKLKIRIHLSYRYLNIKSEVEKIKKKHQLGSIKKIICYSGALDLSTSGSHLVDLAIQCFGSNPKSVISNLYSDKINPRSKDLLYFEGTSIWKFKNNLEFILSMSNSSRISEIIIIIFENAYMVINSNNLFSVYSIDGEISNKIYRHQVADKKLGHGKLFSDEYIPCNQIINDAIMNKKNRSNDKIAFNNIHCILGSIISNDLKKDIKLPVSPNNILANKKFRIS
jgi:predicted dehydrogenase